MNAKSMLSVAMLTAFVAGSAAAQLRDSWTTIESAAKIQVGKSNSKDVEALLGKPGKVIRNNRKSQTDWGYPIYADGRRGTLWITTTDDGVVREVLQILDRRMGTS